MTPRTQGESATDEQALYASLPITGNETGSHERGRMKEGSHTLEQRRGEGPQVRLHKFASQRSSFNPANVIKEKHGAEEGPPTFPNRKQKSLYRCGVGGRDLPDRSSRAQSFGLSPTLQEAAGALSRRCRCSPTVHRYLSALLLLPSLPPPARTPPPHSLGRRHFAAEL